MAARPEFMQSKMVGGIVAEALDQQASVGNGAVSTVLRTAATELRAALTIEAPAEPPAAINGHRSWVTSDEERAEAPG